MNRLLIVSICVLFLCGCPARITRIEDISSNEAAIIAKINAKYNGKDVIPAHIGLDVPSVPITMYQFIPDDNGYIYGRVPLGDMSIGSLIIRVPGVGDFTHRFKSDQLTFKLNREQTIFYLGDITFDCQGTALSVSVESDIAKAEEIFRKKFPHNLETLPSLLVLNPTLQSQREEIEKLKRNWFKVKIGMSFQEVDELIYIVGSTDNFILRGENRLYKLNNNHVLVFQGGTLIEIR